MSDPARDLESRALRLSSKERARLAERLIASLDAESDPHATELWLAEAERRLEEIESGQVPAIPVDEVFAKARSTTR